MGQLWGAEQEKEKFSLPEQKEILCPILYGIKQVTLHEKEGRG